MASPTVWRVYFNFHEALLSICLFSEAAFQVFVPPMKSEGSPEKGPHLSHRISNNGGCQPMGGEPWTDGTLFNVRFSSRVLS